MRAIVLAVAAALLVGACSYETEWPKEKQQEALGTCIEHTQRFMQADSVTFCRCTVDKMKQKYRTQEAVDRSTEEEGRQIGIACVKELRAAKPQ